ncbi:hypothetical protein QQX09_03605 [Demequina sp. SYSU T00192]|uniref:Uncharacterized protein n=1 Tax=Demequina litoralis TaxID=3051660 RepID=A0ABT8G7N9_9MICO|nr:hypothetical protein [Demequina sp. SYSU T00192]MDN4474939.1 hypothetical protein [Demequina sp. SYSU T00192]
MDDAAAPPRLWRGDGTEQEGLARSMRAPTLEGRRVRVRGLGPVGTAAAEGAARAGAASLSLVGMPGAPAAPVARRIGAVVPALRLHLDAERSVDGEIVAAYGAVPSTVHHALMLAGPHVAALTDEAGVTVLPVRPGDTACLRCAGIAATDRDPAWPCLALQCEALPERTEPASAALAGALAVSVLAALLDGGSPVAWRVERGLPRRRRIVPHPRCGCGAT